MRWIDGRTPTNVYGLEVSIAGQEVPAIPGRTSIILTGDRSSVTVHAAVAPATLRNSSGNVTCADGSALFRPGSVHRMGTS